LPYNPPIPESKQRRKGGSLPAGEAESGFASGKGLMGAWIQAEKLMQIALILPCAAFIGWLIGAWLDRHLHQSWIALVGIVFGGASGLVYVIRLALEEEKNPAMQDEETKGTGKGTGGEER
jgi:uncharacterized membrane protein YfcA